MAPRHRLSASIVIPVWNGWDMTRACLETLRPTLGVRDEVIVVDNGSEDATPSGLRSYPWVKVITNETNRGFAAACNQGAALATRDIVVFLNNDTLLSGRWIDGLLEPFADTSVGATGPRSNFVSGEQKVEDAPYLQGNSTDFRRFVKEWAAAHKGETTDVIRLVGFCIAVRRSVFEELEGFDEGFGIGGFEDDDLCARMRAAGHRLLITHESFVHHHGHATFDGNGLDWFEIQNSNKNRFLAKHETTRRTHGKLLAAALIVKDEERLLPACLDSLQGFVDEIVVYDTGSTDATKEIARAAGATVIEGYWDDDFARARNAALEACTAEWVLSIDADEVVETKAKHMRKLIESATVDAGAVEIVNLAGDEGSTHVALRHQAVRLFKRDRCQWQFRLHEQVVARPGLPTLSIGTVDDLKLLHYGYLNEAMAGRNKTERNIRIATADVETEGEEGGSGDRATRLLSLGRSLTLAGRHEEALARFREVTEEAEVAPHILRTALRHGAEVLLALGQVDEALTWIADLRTQSTDHAMTDYLEGTARLLAGDTDAAAALLEGIEDLRAEDGVSYASSSLSAKKGFVRTARGDWEAAADAFLEAAADPTLVEPIWSPMVEACRQTRRSLGPVADAVPPNRLVQVLGQAVLAPPEAADAFAEELWTRFPRDPRLLAFAIRVAPHIAPARALEWSARLRSEGVMTDCPLIALANDPNRSAIDRLTAAAIAYTAFNDWRATTRAESAAVVVSAAEMPLALSQLSELAPDLLPAFVEHAITTAERCACVADAFAALGAHEQAELVRSYGAERFGDPALLP